MPVVGAFLNIGRHWFENEFDLNLEFQKVMGQAHIQENHRIMEN